MFCTKCGKEIDPGSKFCGFCGTPVAPAAVPMPAPAAEPVAPEASAAAVEPAAVPMPAQAAEPVVPETSAAAVEPAAVSMPAQAAEPVAPETSAAAVEPAAAPIPEQAAEPVMAEAPAYSPMQEMPGGPAPQPMSPIPPETGKKAKKAKKQKSGKKKGKAGLIIFFVILLVLIAAGCAAFFLWMNRPAKKIAAAFAEGDVQTAISLYDKVKSQKDIEKISAQAEDYAKQLYKDYLDEAKGAGYDTVSDKLEDLYDTILEGDEDLADMMDEIDRIEESREAFKNAEAYKLNGDFEDAMEEYGKVIKEDEANYELAQEGIAEATELIRADAIREAHDYVADGDYEAAWSALDEALMILPDDVDLLAEYEAVSNAREDALVSEALDNANRAAAEGRYADAANILNRALEDYPDNTELLDAQANLPINDTIIGMWGIDYDFGDIIAEEMGGEFGDYDASLNVTIVFEFMEDGTFRMYLDEEGFTAAYIDYTIEFMYTMLEAEGFDRADADELIESGFDMTMEEYVRMILEEELDVSELLSEVETSGCYATDGDKLFTAEGFNEIDYDGYYDVFMISGDILTIDTPEGVTGESPIPGLDYPYVLYRIQ